MHRHEIVLALLTRIRQKGKSSLDAQQEKNIEWSREMELGGHTKNEKRKHLARPRDFLIAIAPNAP